MKVIVSGSDGFLGSHVCELLKVRGYEVIPLDITNGFDLSKPEVFDELPKADHFIHLANLVYVPMSYEKPYLFYRINYMTTLNALEYCRKNNAHLIYASSYIYGPAQYLPVDEKHPRTPFNPYADTKVICEGLCQSYNKYFGVKSSILRPFNLYGVGQKGKLLIPEIVSQIKKGAEINLKASSPRRDFINVIDVARAFVACLDDDSECAFYNVCSGKSYSIKELTEFFVKGAKEFGVDLYFSFTEEERKNEVDETVGSYDLIHEALGWEPAISLEEGIRAIVKNELNA